MTKELVAKTVMAWHFTNGERISHTGEPLVHRTYTVDPPLELCARGLHASRNPMDALRLGPGLHVSRVRLSGTILDDGIEKLCASRRTVIWHADASLAVIAWGAWCAREVLHLFEMKYPGDLRPRHAVEATEAYVAAARAAAGAAAGDAAWAAAGDAAWDAAGAAWDAAGYAAGDAWDAAGAAGDAAWAAAGDAAGAAGYAAGAAAGDAAGAAGYAAGDAAGAAGYAAGAAAGAAAGDAAGYAAGAAAGAAGYAAGDADWDAQRKELSRLLMALRLP